MKNLMARTMTRGAYDIQALRIAMGNRIVGNFKAKLGQAPGEAEDEISEEGQEILTVLRLSYKRLTDGVVKEGRDPKFPSQKRFVGDEVISTYTELCLVAEYIGLEEAEKQHFKRLGHVLMEYPIFTEFLDKVPGIGPAIAGVIVSEIDIHKAKYASSLWMYAGLDVVLSDNRGRSKRSEHLVDREYVAKDGTTKTKKSITYNPFLKTKLMGVMAGSFLKVRESKYKDMYYQYKNRLENHPVHKEKTKGHRHNMCLRYIVKQFLVDLYMNWRALEGLPVHSPYAEAKLGLQHKVA